ncbi:MAG: RHS repeat protein [Sphingobacteriales bacterium]|nr:RHS repeat protein [Sphingobacteriales bacterium]
MKRILLIILLYWPASGFSGVNIRTGNFYMSYTDIEFPGTGADITRTYNSFTSSTGYFGYGWSSLLETQLFAFPDGQIAIRWWGGGGMDIFGPPVKDRNGLYQMIEKIMTDEISHDKLANNPSAIAGRRAELAADDYTRLNAYIRLIRDKKTAAWFPGRLPREWKRNVNQVIRWNGKNFVLDNWADRYQFNAGGLLTEIREEKFWFRLRYQQQRLSVILVGNQYQCTVSTDSLGRILRLRYSDSSGWKESQYRYDTDNNLVYSKDAGGNEYRYQYDKAHNLIRIGYTDAGSMEISYDPVTNRTLKVKERNGAFTTYQYPYFYTPEGKLNLLHYATRIRKFDSTGAAVFMEYHEYESRTRADGSDYLYRQLTQTDTSYEESLYDPDVGNAFYRKKNKKEAWATYDGKGRCSTLRINDSLYISVYNIQDLPESFIQIDSLRQDTTRYNYRYDGQKELVESSRNGTIYRFSGDRENGILRISRDSLTLEIEYKNGQPQSVSHERLGKISLGEAGKTISPDPRANELLSLYNECAEMLKPKKVAHEWIWERI